MKEGPIQLVSELLDKQLVDPKHDPIGRVDGIVLAWDDEARDPPRVAFIEAGSTVLASRLHPRIGGVVRWFARRWGLRGGRPTRIAWKEIRSGGIEVEVDVKADETNALAWEHWLYQHIVRHIPGGK